LGALVLATPRAASASPAVPASGLIFATGVTLTPISASGDVAILHLHATAIETGTLAGTSIAENTCVEQISTGQAHCAGPETLTGQVAGRDGSTVFFDTYAINLTTGATHGTARITSSTAKVTGVISFAGNAFSPGGLPYTGELVLG
jgi:hypothetical protein